MRLHTLKSIHSHSCSWQPTMLPCPQVGPIPRKQPQTSLKVDLLMKTRLKRTERKCWRALRGHGHGGSRKKRTGSSVPRELLKQSWRRSRGGAVSKSLNTMPLNRLKQTHLNRSHFSSAATLLEVKRAECHVLRRTHQYRPVQRKSARGKVPNDHQLIKILGQPLRRKTVAHRCLIIRPLRKFFVSTLQSNDNVHPHLFGVSLKVQTPWWELTSLLHL
mmetsp:Transcript_14958/g.38365  ORF Transcript_14958/g.38365 Transcript_14958/m.38365 type:complete len:218 (+) Transcript_14958:1095-1748(+)